MRCVVCPEWGPPEVLVVEDREPLAPSEGRVVVDVGAAGVNYVDGLIVGGQYQIKIPAPFTPGSELAGTISAVGAGVTGLAEGDRVLAMPGFGAFAEQVSLPAEQAVVIPDELDLARAATFTQSYCTAVFALTRRTRVEPGEWVLVLGAGGGVGLAAIDVARDTLRELGSAMRLGVYGGRGPTVPRRAPRLGPLAFERLPLLVFELANSLLVAPIEGLGRRAA